MASLLLTSQGAEGRTQSLGFKAHRAPTSLGLQTSGLKALLKLPEAWSFDIN